MYSSDVRCIILWHKLSPRYSGFWRNLSVLNVPDMSKTNHGPLMECADLSQRDPYYTSSFGWGSVHAECVPTVIVTCARPLPRPVACQKYVSPLPVDKERQLTPSENPNQCMHADIPTAHVLSFYGRSLSLLVTGDGEFDKGRKTCKCISPPPPNPLPGSLAAGTLKPPLQGILCPKILLPQHVRVPNH